MARIVKLIPRRRGQWLELVKAEGPSLKLPRHALPPGIEAGSELDEAQWRALEHTSEYHTLYDRALRILALREHFRRELETKLFTRSRGGGLIREVLDDLQERGYVDDQRAAE